MRLFPVLALLAVAACGERQNLSDDAEPRQPSGTIPASVATDDQRDAAQSGEGPAVIFVGTSLTAGYGLGTGQAYPAVVERLAADDGLPIRAVNAGLSGETSAGALRRIDWVLRSPADIVVVETGANDGLRALDVDATRANITAIVRRVQQQRPRARMLLVQMEAPPNFGADYTSRFRAMYGEIAAETGATLLPFLLEGVAAVPEMNLPDGIHPNPAGAERVAANIWAGLRPIVSDFHR
jgi:acyl-CoA thioesterase I